ncbi:uncharacterized protein LOC126427294 isoform X4 [Schistocerca serialis cubense]|uniref:uncharacterized protein LOC126427294 isoform X4 n=1 Tax=Schistocerca serialis cubense TaxID=2023355 RepID=UPI00214E51EC|nr:uncharacterized protein LOC126427294 isoform X4 [Schistocerca serialis cubense]
MDNKKNVEIKKEETNEALIEHISLYLDNPLRIEKTSVHVKEEPEQKWDRDSSEHNLLEDPLMISWSTDCIKEDPELILGVDGTEDIATGEETTHIDEGSDWLSMGGANSD